MASGRYDFTIEQGATFRRTLEWLSEENIPIVLTGYKARLYIKQSEDDKMVLVFLSSEPGGGLTLDENAGKISVFISSVVTGNLNFLKGVYNFEVESGEGEITRLLEGIVTLSKGIKG